MTLRLVAAVVTTALVVSGCARGADEARLRADLQARLEAGVKPGLLTVVALRRAGSAPLPADESGTPRVVVYFNTTLRLAEDYRFGGWDQLAPSSIAFALGATEQGLIGLKTENTAGELVRAYGSAVYQQSPDGWVPVSAPLPGTAAAPDYEGTSPPSRSKQLIDQLAALVELPPPGIPAQQDAIIAEELSRASENIERRVQRREHTYTIASGPRGGEYARFTAAMIAAVQQNAGTVKVRERRTDGSVENARLLARGEADYAIIQSDVAAAAMGGEDLFAGTDRFKGLRAVGGLFLEAIHVVVPAASPIHDIAELRNRRVGIGAAASGTRFDAVAVLAAHDLTPQDLAEAADDAPTAALARLRRRQLDAVFVTTAAPARSLQQLAVETGLRLLPIRGDALERVIRDRPGLWPLLLPANTYPGQQHELATVASTALLVTTADAPFAEVERVAELLFVDMPRDVAAGAAGVRVAAANELRGVTIPLHPGAAVRRD
jgi:TRAP transporter TAXI family solute receptor